MTWYVEKGVYFSVFAFFVVYISFYWVSSGDISSFETPSSLSI